jgi:L,D-transpeptidase YcbB
VYFRVLLAFAACLLPPVTQAAAGPAQTMQHFQLLEQALTRYQALALQTQLTQLPPLPARSVKQGEAYSGSGALRTLLGAVGDLPAGDVLSADQLLDEALVAALRRFQERHGLLPDGVLGRATWRALATPLAARARQIERTLQRWRDLPPNPYRRAIFINIPRFRLYAMPAAQDAEVQMLQLDVVVGRAIADLHTPTFVADMTHVIFRPYWDVPRTIALRELLPEARRDPGYLAAHHYELVSGDGSILTADTSSLDALAGGSLRIRQRPGADNALGAVKFVMPNPHDVYLHDTPARALFSQVRRAYSHGCVRVADPQRLASFVLQDDPAWNGERIDQAMAGTEPVRVNLQEPIRVYFVYGTAIAREDGSVLFLDDLYGLDGS